MPAHPPNDFAYVHTDIPEGMTIREWRAQRAADRAAAQAAAREARRRRRMQANARWLAAVRMPAHGHRLRSREARGLGGAFRPSP